ncbi:MAG: Cys-tRNA(Pro) deacylase [Symbiobacteriaceae bacterium]|nr:Cys-tRNA(Pro) deacylase [Symbiobacteriaceae bacterium]
MTKTQVVRILEARQIVHLTHTYDTSDGGISGIQVAAKIGAEPERVFKTLVTQGRAGTIYVFVVPCNAELDLKKAALAAGDKSIMMLKQQELKSRTGYEHGGCSPIAMIKQYPTYIDETALLFEKICVSGGRIGLQIELAPENLAMLTNAEFRELF